MYNNNIKYPSIDVIRRKMDQVMVVVPELSLGPSISIDQKSTTTSSSLTSDQSSETSRSLKKRKSFDDHIVQTNNKHVVVARQSLDDFFLHDVQVKRDRLPLEWEQCLDLKSGKIYFLNRKTAEKVCDRPTTLTDDHQHDQKHEKQPLLELELNISSPTSSSTHYSNASFKQLSHNTSQQNDQCKPTTTTSCVVGSNNMVALACSNCHLLVILSKSSPSCPNCKYVHCYLHSTDDQHEFKASPNRSMKPINTLTLFS